MRRTLAALVALAAVALWLVPAAASAAGRHRTAPAGGAEPAAHGRYSACSGKACVQLDGYPSLGHPGNGQGRLSYFTSVPYRHTFEPIADGAVFTATQQPGLTADPSSVQVTGATGSDVTASGNKLSVTLTDTGDQSIEITFEVSFDQHADTDLTSQGALTFRSKAAGGPTVTSKSPYVTFSSGSDVSLSGFETGLNPEVGSQDFGGVSTTVPRGFHLNVQGILANVGAGDLPAGAKLIVTTSPGFRLGAAVVRRGNGDDNGPPLPCSGSAPRYTCTLPSLVAGGGSLSLRAQLWAAADLPVGRQGSLTFSVPAAPIGDVNPDDNSTTLNVTVGPLAQLTPALRIDPSPAPVGSSATATLIVRNEGPDVAHGYSLTLLIVSRDVHVDDTGGGKQASDVPQPFLVFSKKASLRPGRSKTFRVRITPTRTASQVHFYLAVGPRETFSRCYPAPGYIGGACVLKRSTVDFVPAGTTSGGGGGLANTGADAAQAALLGVLLLLLGGALVVLGRRPAPTQD